MDLARRRTERAARTGDQEALARALAERVRAGDLPARKARLMALLGHGPAVAAFGDQADPDPATDLSGWLRQVVHGVRDAGLDVLRVAAGPCRAFIDALEARHERPGLDMACECPWAGPDMFEDGRCTECGLPDAPASTATVPFTLVMGMPLRHLDRAATGAGRPWWGASTGPEARERLLEQLRSMHEGWSDSGDQALVQEIQNATPRSDSPEHVVQAVAWCGRTVDAARLVRADLLPVVLGTGDPAVDRIQQEDEDQDRRNRLASREEDADARAARWDDEQDMGR